MRTITLAKAWAGRPIGTVLRVLEAGSPPELGKKDAVDHVRAAKLQELGYVKAEAKSDGAGDAKGTAAPKAAKAGKG